VPQSESYESKKAFFRQMLTIYGRNTVKEALGDHSLQCYALHLADSNRPDGIIKELVRLAQQRNISIKYHSRSELSRISRNGKQDQGVAADIVCPAFNSADAFLADLKDDKPVRLLALDGITNPQNVGMIIRSAAAGDVDGIVYPSRGCASLGPLVLKASAGTLYKAPILHCESLGTFLEAWRMKNYPVAILAADAEQSLFAFQPERPCIYVLGSESDGVSKQVRALGTHPLSITMRNGVESLNVAVTASLIAFAGQLGGQTPQ
jgi:23S rRNA (guanosine2251-2'-O)-methyltransferase